MITRGDLVVLALCAATIAAAFALLAPARGAATAALVEVRGAPPLRIALDRDGRHAVAGRRGPSVIEVRAGRARFVASPCPEKLCIRAGWLARAGESSACVPNGVSLTLVGAEPAYDAVTL